MNPSRIIEPMALSVIIPVGPGDAEWPMLLADLSALPVDCEVIMVGTDAAVVPSADAGADARVRWIRAKTGRASQLNAGVAAARNPVLWLLHADTRLPAASLDRLLAQLPGADELAYFDLRFSDGPAWMALNAAGTWLRSRVGRMPFGDQGFVMHKSTLQRLGGFDPGVGRGEDHALVWRARRAGIRLKPLGCSLSTSARRYIEHGWWRTTRTHVSQTLRQAWRFSRRARP